MGSTDAPTAGPSLTGRFAAAIALTVGFYLLALLIAAGLLAVAILPWVLNGRNNIWVSLPGDRGPHSMFQVFNPDGVLLGNVPAVGGGKILDGFWIRDRVYVSDEDENGLPIIRVYRIVKDGQGN